MTANSTVTTEALKRAEIIPAMLAVAGESGLSDDEAMQYLAVGLCVLAVRAGRKPDEVADMVREAWPDAALAVIELAEADHA